MTNVLIVTEEQAVALEKAGIKVDVQYIVRLSDFAKLNEAQAPAPQPKPRPVTTRVVRYGHDCKLRWTGLKWAGGKDTESHACYQHLHDHFTARNCTSMVIKRADLTRLLVKALAERGKQFNAGTITYLCDQKYLELVS
jgi:hypothetical protein